MKGRLAGTVETNASKMVLEISLVCSQRGLRCSCRLHGNQAADAGLGAFWILVRATQHQPGREM